MTRTERKFPAPQVDYRQFRLNRIHEPQYAHLKLLLFWPIYFLRYPIIEAINYAERCFPVSCSPVKAFPARRKWFRL